MQPALVVVLVLAVTASAFGAWRLMSAPRRVVRPESEAMRTALHHATATLPHLRRGLYGPSARKAAPHLRALTQAAALAITDEDSVLAVDGASGSGLDVSWLLEAVAPGGGRPDPRRAQGGRPAGAGRRGCSGGGAAGDPGAPRRRADRAVRARPPAAPRRRAGGR